ncbi:hypothetical protein PUN28_003112 [Cardiocondyla obscurior]|uniref:Uncharacterized protein n=1 Tax=Cardiocondyla obscurior TaxID=286306 RepID=A0AAW2GJ51_9HYME
MLRFKNIPKYISKIDWLNFTFLCTQNFDFCILLIGYTSSANVVKVIDKNDLVQYSYFIYLF